MDISHNTEKIIEFTKNVTALTFNDIKDDFYDALPSYTAKIIRSIYENSTD